MAAAPAPLQNTYQSGPNQEVVQFSIWLNVSLVELCLMVKQRRNCARRGDAARDNAIRVASKVLANDRETSFEQDADRQLRKIGGA
jgi:hypothetical protein